MIHLSYVALRQGRALQAIAEKRILKFLYALRREVLRNLSPNNYFPGWEDEAILYALRREVLRHDGASQASS